jgi:hypothetical protein
MEQSKRNRSSQKASGRGWEGLRFTRTMIGFSFAAGNEVEDSPAAAMTGVLWYGYGACLPVGRSHLYLVKGSASPARARAWLMPSHPWPRHGPLMEWVVLCQPSGFEARPKHRLISVTRIVP